MNQTIIDKIVSQSINEISFARSYKNGKITNWQKNEDIYYAKKSKPLDSRANVDLARGQEFVHTLLSKIDNPLTFRFSKRKESQLSRVQRLNALKEVDRKNDFWDIKDLAGKKQMIIYGRTINSYYADEVNGYKPHLENIDVYDFLIDPSAGGIDIEQGMYMGDYGVVKMRWELETGIKKGDFLKIPTRNLLNGVGNNTERPQEEINKQNRERGQNTIGQTELQNNDKFKFWRWFTTYQGERYYLLLQENGTCIRCERLTDIFSPTKMFPLGAFPYWTYAAYPDLTEFWTPSPMDYIREIFMAQNVSINQMLDNAEAINKPMRFVNVSAIENLAELKYRKDGWVKVKGGYDPNNAYSIMNTPSINTPIQVFNILESIQEKSLGVTSGTKGVADEDGKVGIYEGNQIAAADRFNLFNRCYSVAYERMGRLWEIGVRDNLTKKVAVDIIGPEGIETEEVSRRDIFRKNDEFGVIVQSSNDELIKSTKETAAKIQFLQTEAGNPNLQLNQKKAFEIKATALRFSDDEIKELLDVSEYGNNKIMSEAARDIERLLDGEDILPNEIANNAYKQKFVDYMKDHKEDLTDEQYNRLTNYVMSLDNVIVNNEARSINNFQIKQLESGNVQELPEVNQEVVEENPLINNQNA